MLANISWLENVNAFFSNTVFLVIICLAFFSLIFYKQSDIRAMTIYIREKHKEFEANTRYLTEKVVGLKSQLQYMRKAGFKEKAE